MSRIAMTTMNKALYSRDKNMQQNLCLLLEIGLQRQQIWSVKWID